MEHSSIRAQLKECVSALLKNTDHLPITLRPYQIQDLQAFENWLAKTNAPHRCFMVQAGGLGKTVLFSAITSFATGLRTLIIVPTKVLLEQTARVIVKFTNGLIGHISSLKKIRNGQGEVIAVRGHNFQDVVITTEDSFVRYASALSETFSPGLIIWDECHGGYTPMAQNALRQFPETIIMGFTATPDYLTTVAKSGYLKVKLDNGRQLYCPPDRRGVTNFGTLLVERGIRWGIEEGWLAPFAWGEVEFNISGEQLDQLPLTLGSGGIDYNEKALQNLMAKYWPLINQTIARLYKSDQYELAQRQVIAICHSVKAAKQLAETIHNLGVPSAMVIGDTPDTERNAILAAYQANEIRFLSSVMVLREGWDAPNAEVCMMLRPTKSRVLYQQSMGRVLRPDITGGYKVALVLDAHFMHIKFAPLNTPILFAKPDDKIIQNDIIIRPKKFPFRTSGETKTKISSPYLPEGFIPKLVIIPALETEYWAGKDGTFEADGEIWGHVSALTREFKWTNVTIKRWLEKNTVPVRSKQGRDQKGRITTFYCLSDARMACAELLKIYPEVSADGTALYDGEIYGPIWALKNLLKISQSTLSRRIQSASDKVASKKGLSSNGNNITNFYRLLDVKNLCTDLSDPYPRMNKKGTVIINGKVWASTVALARRLNLRFVSDIQKLVKEFKIPSKFGRNWIGAVVKLYPVIKIRKSFNAKKELPKAGPDGTLTSKDGEVWASCAALAELLNVSESCVKKCSYCFSQRFKIDRKSGHDQKGRRMFFYKLNEFRQLYLHRKRRSRTKR